jgi:hypothetical protein
VAISARVTSLIRNLTRRDRVERDLNDELRATVEVLAAEKMRAGMAPDVARRAALAELGGIEAIKERVRDVRSGATLDTLSQDVRYASRLLRRYPLFALTAALSLAVGIGANTAVFTIANSVLRFSPSGVAEPDRVVDLGRSLDGLTFGLGTSSYPDYLDVRRRTRTLEHVYARMLFPRTMTLAASTGAEPVAAEVVTTNYFATLRTRAALGRLFDPGESEQQGANPVVVLSHQFWMRRFNADPAIVGQTVRLNRYPVTVLGVAPEGFQGTTVVAVDLWVPMNLVTLVTGAQQAGLDARQAGWLVMGARLRPGATLAQAAADLDGIGRCARSTRASRDHDRSVCSLPHRWRTRCRWRPPLSCCSQPSHRQSS